MCRTARVAPEKAVFRPALPLRSLPGSFGADMTKMSYAEQLKHPKWQRKRLEALNRSGFKCEACGEAEKMLHVHHKRYVRGKSAWDYELGDLSVLCEPCHAREHDVKDALARLMTTRFANDANVETFTYSFLCGFLLPWGSVKADDMQRAAEAGEEFMGLGVLIAALGPVDIIAAVRRKMEEGRLNGDQGLVKMALAAMEGEPEA